MSSRLPLIIALVVSFGIIGAAGYARFAPKEQAAGTASQATLIAALGSSIADVDTDSDNLKDWEETLWGTDPKTADTDGDGTSDGEEVAASRNPAIAGDGKTDVVSKEAYDPRVASTTLEDTATARFSRDFFAKYLSIKQAGGEVSLDDQQTIIEGIIAEEQSKLTLPSLSLADITVSDKTTLKQYGDLLGAVSRNRQPEGGNTQLVIIADSIMANDETKLLKLKPIQQNYALIISDLRKLPAPRSIIDAHLALVNALVLIESGVRGLTQVTTDPLSAMARAQFYFDGITGFDIALDNIKAIFIRSGTTFSPQDDGYELFKGI
jgi:hypothetical protein